MSRPLISTEAGSKVLKYFTTSKGQVMITRALSEGIRDWIASKPDRRNLSLLSRLSNVSYATVRRIASNEGEPSCDVAACICDVIFDKERTKEFLETYYPRLARVLNRFSASEMEAQIYTEVYANPNFLPVIALATKDSGISRQALVLRLGESALDEAEELCELGVLRSFEGAYFASHDHAITGVGLLARNQAETLLKFCRDKLDGNPQLSRSQVMIKGLSAEGLEAVYSVVDDSLEAIVSILNDRQYRGDLVWAGFWAHQVFDGEKEIFAEKLG